MGTWSIQIEDNDTFQDIYQHFFDYYNQGDEPVTASEKVLGDFEEAFQDSDDRIYALFALAKAQWETCSLAPWVHEAVSHIITSGQELGHWRGQQADSKMLQARQKELKRFLQSISKEKKKAKPRSKIKFDYHSETLLSLTAPDGLKTFEVIESYVNGKYQNTSSGLSWSGGGGSVFYFEEQGKTIEAEWLDNHILIIRHDSSLHFTQLRETFYYSGDGVNILYVPMDQE